MPYMIIGIDVDEQAVKAAYSVETDFGFVLDPSGGDTIRPLLLKKIADEKEDGNESYMIPRQQKDGSMYLIAKDGQKVNVQVVDTLPEGLEADLCMCSQCQRDRARAKAKSHDIPIDLGGDEEMSGEDFLRFLLRGPARRRG